MSEEAADDSEGTESNLKNPDIVNGKSNAENEITDETQEKLSKYEKQYQSLEMRYASLKEKYTDISLKYATGEYRPVYEYEVSILAFSLNSA